MNEITRDTITLDWTLWATLENSTHAVLMEREDGTQVWVGTTASIANQYANQNGQDRAAVIIDHLMTNNERMMSGSGERHSVGTMHPDPDWTPTSERPHKPIDQY